MGFPLRFFFFYIFFFRERIAFGVLLFDGKAEYTVAGNRSIKSHDKEDSCPVSFHPRDPVFGSL